MKSSQSAVAVTTQLEPINIDELAARVRREIREEFAIRQGDVSNLALQEEIKQLREEVLELKQQKLQSIAVSDDVAKEKITVMLTKMKCCGKTHFTAFDLLKEGFPLEQVSRIMSSLAKEKKIAYED